MKTAIIGSGLIGRSWAMVFARGGHDVAMWDQDPEQPERALDVIAGSLREMEKYRLVSGADTIAGRIRIAGTLAEAVTDAGFIQENIVERAEPKQRLFAELEDVASSDAILSSSTSAIMPSIIFGQLKTRSRCLVAHPLNPPHLAPIVEMCGADFTDAKVLARASDFMAGCDMSPIQVRKEIEGFILNRLQLAVLNEAFRLIGDGYVSAEDLDKTLKDGLALRWSFMGPIETIDLNAPDGVADYLERYGPTIRRVGQQQAAAPDWPTEVGVQLDTERRALVPRDLLASRQAWRDRRLMALAAHKLDAGKRIRP